MMADEDIKLAIQEAIKAFATGDLTDNALKLFRVLGYGSERRVPLSPRNYDQFRANFIKDSGKFNEDKALVKEWLSVDMLFQLTRDELTDQESLFKDAKVDNRIIESYLFFAIELEKEHYNRTTLSQITREVNKSFQMPVMILFKYGGSITIAVINRRLHKKDEQKDVLLKVTVIKDISIAKPHRAHVEILFDLSWVRQQAVYKCSNFVELHDAWQKTLDINELNKKFYKEVSNWFFWAVKHRGLSFPNVINDKDDDRDFNSENVIRMLTRIIFVWFLKEKGLIPDKIFDKADISTILKKFDEKDSSVYYRAILQNLFFATLNKEISGRKFASDATGQNKEKNYYLYEKSFLIPKSEVKELFKSIPFLNGGLFDCLDGMDKDNEIYPDGFSEKSSEQANVPDELFFSEGKTVDLSKIYDDRRKKSEKVKGLFAIFNGYKFTVAENTPIEEEVALDPELLGRVFENLLAAYNPETQTTARKATGSFYTPREIVEYMVDESLLAYLKQKLTEGTDMNPDDAETGLRHLIGYYERGNVFDEAATKVLISAIKSCKILDPACGSGAFPMGILHKMVHILQALDPDNKLWKKQQLKEVGKSYDKADTIEERFSSGDTADYARKFYLIEECIHGVDIQPIAVQISKLRFFISLIVDQKKGDDPKNNYNIVPLPNLETKFVSANTLIPLTNDETAGIPYENETIKRFTNDLADVRHKLFSASPQEKAQLRDKDRSLRDGFAATLKKLKESELKSAMSSSKEAIRLDAIKKMIRDTGEKSALIKEREKLENIIKEKEGEYCEESQTMLDQILEWDPYNQNASSPFFDPEWMFGIKEGFDIVIGNPPYVQLQKEHGKLADLYDNHGYITLDRYGDIYTLFYENGINSLANNGHLCFITSSKWMRSSYGHKLRGYFVKYNPKILIALGPGIFESATVDTNILLIQNADYSSNLKALVLQDQSNEDVNIPNQLSKNGITLSELNDDSWFLGSSDEQILKKKIEKIGKPLMNWDLKIFRGVITGLNQAYIIDNDKKEELCEEDPKSSAILKPILRGRDIKKYNYEWAGIWLILVKHDFHKELRKYPAILKHLTQYEEELRNRGQCKYSRAGNEQGQHHWLELDNNPKDDYLKEFDKEKLVWIEIVDTGRFAFVEAGMYAEATTTLMTASKPKYMVALLNSKTINWYFKGICASSGMGTNRWKKIYVEKLPLPEISANNKMVISKIETIVDKILTAKRENPLADTSTLESQIDQFVYQLYGLTEEEIKIVEGSKESDKHINNSDIQV